jgi:hypothetical protein
MECVQRNLYITETKQWREEFIRKKWLSINEDIEYKKIINCTNAAKLKKHLEVFIEN